MSKNLCIIIIEKGGGVKSHIVKDYKEEELYKKCGFKSANDFTKQTIWDAVVDGKKCKVAVYAKIKGKAGMENKYDFPPPIDKLLFFGNCAIVAYILKDETPEYISLSLINWERIYEKLFGGFEELHVSNLDGDDDEDELANVSEIKKTKTGYLKDGFIVDSDSDDKSDYDDDDDEDDGLNDGGLSDDADEEEDNDDELEDIGNELTEEAYITDDEE